MSTRIEFFYDYASPYSWLADLRLPAIAARHGATIEYRPTLLGGVIMGAGNTPPPTVPAKAAYYAEDIARWARRLGAEYRPNPAFPLNALTVLRGALVARDRGEFAPYHAAFWRAVWGEARDVSDPAVAAEVMIGAGLDADAILAGAADPAVKARLKANVEEALGRGAFGLPSFFVDGALYFGNDRVDFVEDALTGASRPSATPSGAPEREDTA